MKIVLISLLVSAAAASVIGIDYGTDWFKVSIVKPGLPLDIVLNRESQRKTGSVVTLRDHIRYLGSDSAALVRFTLLSLIKATKNPLTTYPALKSILGKRFSHPAAQEYKRTYLNGLLATPDRSTCMLKADESEYLVEELLAMQLGHARDQAEKHGGEIVYGAVITVPPYFGQFERQAVLDGAELVGLRVLALINDETAVALNYAMTRSFNETQHHIFYDMGAGSTVATLVKFTTEVITEGRSNRSVPTLQVIAMGYDASLGGAQIDARLSTHLLTSFIAKTKGQLSSDAASNPRAVAKFLKEANRVKQILSANSETFASIENVMEDVDFKLKVTREELEGLSKDIIGRCQTPIMDVLKASGLKIADVASLILVGGSVRIPAIQTKLREVVGDDKIAQNINGDEAAVLGAGFMAATISRQYRVREILVRDVTSDMIDVSYLTEKDAKLHNVTIFPLRTALGSKKLMIVRRKTDFDLTIQYKDSKLPIMTVSVSGLTELIESFKDRSNKDPKVKALIEINESGMISVSEVTATFNLDNVTSIADSVLSFFGGDKANDSEDDTNTTTTVPSPATNATNTTAPIAKPKFEVVQLNFTVAYKTIAPLSQEIKMIAKDRLRKMDAEDKIRSNREEAHNTLEAFVYASRDFLENKIVLTVSNVTQRAELKAQIDADGLWLSENGESATKEEFNTRLAAITEIHAPIKYRKTEQEGRKALVKTTRARLDEIRAWYESAVQNMTLVFDANAIINANSTSELELAEVLYSETELESLVQDLIAMELWIDLKITEQDAQDSWLEPVLTRAKVRETIKAVSDAHKILAVRRPAPRKPKRKAITTKADESTTSVVEESQKETQAASENDSVVEEADKSDNVPVEDETAPEATGKDEL